MKCSDVQQQEKSPLTPTEGQLYLTAMLETISKVFWQLYSCKKVELWGMNSGCWAGIDDRNPFVTPPKACVWDTVREWSQRRVTAKETGLGCVGSQRGQTWAHMLMIAGHDHLTTTPLKWAVIWDGPHSQWLGALLESRSHMLIQYQTPEELQTHLGLRRWTSMSAASLAAQYRPAAQSY